MDEKKDICGWEALCHAPGPKFGKFYRCTQPDDSEHTCTFDEEIESPFKRPKSRCRDVSSE